MGCNSFSSCQARRQDMSRCIGWSPCRGAGDGNEAARRAASAEGHDGNAAHRGSVQAQRCCPTVLTWPGVQTNDGGFRPVLRADQCDGLISLIARQFDGCRAIRHSLPRPAPQSRRHVDTESSRTHQHERASCPKPIQFPTSHMACPFTKLAWRNNPHPLAFIERDRETVDAAPA